MSGLCHTSPPWLTTRDQYGRRKLRGTVNDYRIRIGDYRVTSQVRDAELIVLIVAAGHRSDVYRR